MECEIAGDYSYFERLGKKESIRKLAEHENLGTLEEFIGRVAPDYISNGDVQTFKLLDDAKLW